MYLNLNMKIHIELLDKISTILISSMIENNILKKEHLKKLNIKHNPHNNTYHAEHYHVTLFRIKKYLKSKTISKIFKIVATLILTKKNFYKNMNKLNLVRMKSIELIYQHDLLRMKMDFINLYL